MKILLIEDDEIINNAIVDNLLFEGYEIDSSFDGKEGLDYALKKLYDIIIIDLMLPRIYGLDILKKIRDKDNEIPIMILTANKDECTKLEGFRFGADDYICKPFSLPELLARIKAILKRRVTKKISSKENTLKIGKGIFNFDNYTFIINNKVIECSKYEMLILKLFSTNFDKIYSRDEILHFAWGADVFPTDRTIDNYIMKLRKKLNICIDSASSNIIESIYGVGYRLNMGESKLKELK